MFVYIRNNNNNKIFSNSLYKYISDLIDFVLYFLNINLF